MAHVWDTKTPLLEPKRVANLPHQTSTSDPYVHTQFGAGALAGAVHVDPKMREVFRGLNPAVSHWHDNGKGLGLNPATSNIYDVPKNSAAAFGSPPFNFDVGERATRGTRLAVGSVVKSTPA